MIRLVTRTPNPEHRTPNPEHLQERLVHAARPIAFKVERDVAEAEFLELADDDSAGGEFLHLIRLHFDARNIAVVAYAARREAELVKEPLRLLDEAVRSAPAQRVVQYGAAAAYRRVLDREPGNVGALVGLGRTLSFMGRPDQARERFREALRLDPEEPRALSGLAHVLATHTDPARRDPREAVRLARRAVELTGHRDPRSLATLADAACDGRVGHHRGR